LSQLLDEARTFFERITDADFSAAAEFRASETGAPPEIQF